MMTDEDEGHIGARPATGTETRAAVEGAMTGSAAGDAIADSATAHSTTSGTTPGLSADGLDATRATEAAETATGHVRAATDTTGGAPETAAAAANVDTPATETALTTTVAAAATGATANDAGATPVDNVRLRDALEAIKTAIVWLVVIQILTILSPLLNLSLKWTLIVGFLLFASGMAVAALAYRKAQRAQRSLPE